MSNYFRKFPETEYKFRINGSILNVNLKDIGIKFNLTDKVLNTKDAFYPFMWRDKDRPDTLSQKYYDSFNFFWLVMMSNRAFNPYSAFPKTDPQFNEWLYKKYKDDAVVDGYEDTLYEVIRYTSNTIAEYRDGDGDVIDQDTYQSLNDSGKKQINLFDLEVENNESKRRVQLLDNTYANKVETELEKKLNSVSS